MEEDRKKWPPTTRRVALHTSRAIIREIEARTIANVARYSLRSGEAVSHRLSQLEREWDTDRIIEAMAGTFVVMGTLLGVTINRRWFFVSALAGGFLVSHAFSGWCPSLPVLRKLGARTAEEIAEERMALKVLRGDFKPTTHVHEALAQTRMV
ncbi:YgaP-like transmembrane domain [Sulfoacidibacillus thermotolerans]|uniref:Inner membrane protein YgaP-like transmembrane domain-containing protein n=1 Tax=Sulfoacidibacillus thermotolerans TaxID=1765684 RepID=A0A2U3D7Z1_SULT2|nr:YgaP-like transmembrane domain [Sulfoacidibacillus thermotolerans]PWI57414.1 hypothetical protein BM613_08805 [Sulfoacidibacillus thermotolerans]